MGNSSSTSTSKQTKEALLNFDHGEVEALKKNYQRLASSTAPKGLISVEALSTELHISEWLAANLMRALQDAANPTLGPSKRAESVIGFERFVVSLTLCCSSTQSDRRDFALLALSGDGGSVSKETVRAILEETIKKTLPHDTPKRPALLQDVLDDAVKASFERVRALIPKLSVEKVRERCSATFPSKILQAHRESHTLQIGPSMRCEQSWIGRGRLETAPASYAGVLNLRRAQQGGGESMSSEQVAAWFQEDQGTAEFISLLMRSHFLRDYQGTVPCLFLYAPGSLQHSTSTIKRGYIRSFPAGSSALCTIGVVHFARHPWRASSPQTEPWVVQQLSAAPESRRPLRLHPRPWPRLKSLALTKVDRCPHLRPRCIDCSDHGGSLAAVEALALKVNWLP